MPDYFVPVTYVVNEVVDKAGTLRAHLASNILLRATENWNILVQLATGFQNSFPALFLVFCFWNFTIVKHKRSIRGCHIYCVKVECQLVLILNTNFIFFSFEFWSDLKFQKKKKHTPIIRYIRCQATKCLF